MFVDPCSTLQGLASDIVFVEFWTNLGISGNLCMNMHAVHLHLHEEDEDHMFASVFLHIATVSAC